MKASKKWRSIIVSIMLLICILIILILSGITFAKKMFPLSHKDIVLEYSTQYNIDPYMVYAIIKAESNFRPEVMSEKKARGLMQIAEITGNWGSVELDIDDFDLMQLYDVDTNIKIGCWYIDRLYQEFGDCKNTVICAYNAGSGNVSKWLKNPVYTDDGCNLIPGNIPFPETKKYLKKVEIFEQIYRYLYDEI